MSRPNASARRAQIASRAATARRANKTRTLGTQRLIDLERRMRRGIEFREIKSEYSINDSAAYDLINRVKRDLKATVTVEGRGDDRIYRSVGGTSISLELPHDQVLPAFFILRDATERLFTPVMSGAHTLNQSIRTQIDATVERQLKALEGRIKLRFIGSRQGNPGVLNALIEAMTQNRTVRVEYLSARAQADAVIAKADQALRAAIAGEPAEAPRSSDGLAAKAPALRHVEPYAIFYARRALYAIVRPLDEEPRKPPARGQKVGEWSHLRTMKLSRIARCVPGDQTFRMPASFTIDKYLEDAWEIIRTDRSPKSTVVVDVAPEYGINIADTMWHITQEHRVIRGGVNRFTFRVRGFDEIRYWLLWLGEGATVVRPKALRDEVRRLATAIAAKYPE